MRLMEKLMFKNALKFILYISREIYFNKNISSHKNKSFTKKVKMKCIILDLDIRMQ